MADVSSRKSIPSGASQHESKSQTRTTHKPNYAGPKTRAWQQRLEPSFGAVPPHHSTNPAYGQLHGLSSSHRVNRDQPPFAVKEKTARSALMTSIFLLGIGVGVSAAWWVNRLTAENALSTVNPVRHVRPTASAPDNVPQASPTLIRGIQSSELPYDGIAPSSVSVERESTATRAVTTKSPSSASPSNTSHTPIQAESATMAPSTNLAQQPVNASAAVASATTKSLATVKSSSKTMRSNATAAPKHRTSSRTVKDREIERIRQQAGDELKRNMAQP